jgi:MerC mercury resistance protein
MTQKINWDALGITTSILCAIHCAILPLMVASLPILGINIIENTRFEYGMIGLAFLIGSWSLWHGFSRHHRRFGPLLLFCSGMLFLLSKQIWHQYQFWLLPFAVLLIVSAHILNYRFSRRHSPSPNAAPTVPDNSLPVSHN